MMKMQAASRRLWCKTILAVTVSLLSFHALADGVSPDGFREIKVAPGLATADQFLDVIAPFMRDHPESLEGTAAMDLSVRKDEAGFRVEIVKTGFLDDSVKGEHWRGFVIRNSDGQWELLSMSVKYLCHRGNSDDGMCL